jgi:hypothetical protein
LDVSSCSPNLLSDQVHGHPYCVRTQARSHTRDQVSTHGTSVPHPHSPNQVNADLPKSGLLGHLRQQRTGSVPSVPQRKTRPIPKAQNNPVRIHSPPVVERKRNIATAQDEEVNRHRNVLSQLPGRRSPAARDNPPPSRKSATRTCRS